MPTRRSWRAGWSVLVGSGVNFKRSNPMSKFKHYTPPLPRFTVCALYHAAKEKRIPMTKLANELVLAGLAGSEGLKKAQEAMQLQEQPVAYRTQ